MQRYERCGELRVINHLVASDEMQWLVCDECAEAARRLPSRGRPGNLTVVTWSQESAFVEVSDG